jgi:DNA replication licensing factor MCM6
MDEDDDEENEDDVDPARRNGKGRRARGRGADDDVPRVKDATGESVMKTFQEFLEKYVISYPLLSHRSVERGTSFVRTSSDQTNSLVPSINSFTDSIDFTPATPRSTADLGDDDDEQSTAGKPYLEQIKVLREYQQTTLYVDFSHILEREAALTSAIRDQYYR